MSKFIMSVGDDAYQVLQTGGHEKMDLSTGTFESCNYSRMGRPILGCSEGTSQTCDIPADSIMICQSCHKSILDGETWHHRYDAKAGMLEPVHDKCSKDI
jgi:hypothetical protein